jgi:hypothetical protein
MTRFLLAFLTAFLGRSVFGVSAAATSPSSNPRKAAMAWSIATFCFSNRATISWKLPNNDPFFFRLKITDSNTNSRKQLVCHRGPDFSLAVGWWQFYKPIDALPCFSRGCHSLFSTRCRLLPRAFSFLHTLPTSTTLRVRIVFGPVNTACVAGSLRDILSTA